MKVVKLSESGLAWHERFSFYDQVHTTGMDIKQAVDACAALTLGKDMVFRDYAQGAFRMRGIGKGQTIKLLIIPEIIERIKTEVSLGSGRPVDDFNNPKKFLQDVISWLVINSMRVDGIQFNLLCEQSVCNIWRKSAFAALLAHCNEVELEKNFTPDIVKQSLQIFRERVDYSIENSVPQVLRYSEIISGMIQAHR